MIHIQHSTVLVTVKSITIADRAIVNPDNVIEIFFCHHFNLCLHQNSDHRILIHCDLSPPGYKEAKFTNQSSCVFHRGINNGKSKSRTGSFIWLCTQNTPTILISSSSTSQYHRYPGRKSPPRYFLPVHSIGSINNLGAHCLSMCAGRHVISPLGVISKIIWTNPHQH